MRILWVALVVVMFNGFSTSASSAENGAQTREDARAILQLASRRAVQRSSEVVFSYYWTLKQIIDVQIQAGDFDGARETLMSYHHESVRNQILKELAFRYCGEGQLDAAFELLSQHTDYKINRSPLEDEGRLHWIDRLIDQNDLKSAAEQIRQLKSKSQISEGLQKLATAHFKAGERTLANEEFSVAINMAAESTKGMLKIANAQLKIGQIDAAKETIQTLISFAETSDGRRRFDVLAQSALILAKANDQVMAQRRFEEAVNAVKDVDALNKTSAIARIAKLQADAGYFADALKTVSMSHVDSNDSAFDEAISTIAIGQFESGDEDVACRTLSSIKNQAHRTKAFRRFTEFWIAMTEFDKAVISAKKIENASTRASMLMKVAVGLVNSGNKNAADEIANRIELISYDPILELVANKPTFSFEKFDFCDPPSWGRTYQPAYNLASIRRSVEQAAEVAGIAMTLSIKLRGVPDVSLTTAFKEFDPEVIRSLARAHAANGNPNDALAWSKELPTAKTDGEDQRILDRRQDRQIHALIGVAEGILDRTSSQNP